MDNSRDVLGALAVANQRLLDLAAALSRKPGVKEVHHQMDCRPYEVPDQITLQFYVDAELEHGPSLVWNLDAWWLPDWGIRVHVDFVYGPDQEDVRRFPERRVDNWPAFAIELANAVDQLLRVSSEIEITGYLGRFPVQQ